ncbi:MAG: heme-degrading domain-containing protein [Chthoniobacterales bacterium]
MELSKDLEVVARQERELVLPQFDEDIAWELGVRLRELALDRRLPVTIEVRRFGQPLFYSALKGSTPDNAEWVRRKGNVVARFHRSSYAIGLSLQQTKTTLAEKYELSAADYASHGGSFPLGVTGAGVVGCVTVSGLPQRADHELVVEALCCQLGREYRQLALPNP